MTYGAKWRNWRTVRSPQLKTSSISIRLTSSSQLQGSMFGPKVAPNVKPMQVSESAVLMYDYLMNKDLSKQHKILRRYVPIFNNVGVEEFEY